MKHVASCEKFQRTGKSTQPALPTLPERGVMDTEVILLLETIDNILTDQHALSQIKTASSKPSCKRLMT
jgi:hypothetical protein